MAVCLRTFEYHLEFIGNMLLADVIYLMSCQISRKREEKESRNAFRDKVHFPLVLINCLDKSISLGLRGDIEMWQM